MSLSQGAFTNKPFSNGDTTLEIPKPADAGRQSGDGEEGREKSKLAMAHPQKPTTSGFSNIEYLSAHSEWAASSHSVARKGTSTIV